MFVYLKIYIIFPSMTTMIDLFYYVTFYRSERNIGDTFFHQITISGERTHI